jgi:hypothetical protein
MPRSVRLVVLAVSITAAACRAAGPAAAPPAAPAEERAADPAAAAGVLGDLTLTITGSADCQRLFRDGMLAMHSFMYEQARLGFEQALAADPTCAMAAWGVAMSHNHPIWSQRAAARGRAALAQVTDEAHLTAVERDYLAVARALYGPDDLRAAYRAWLAAAAAMARAHPGDDEVALQHALALLSVYGYDPDHVREQMDAGAIALDVLARQPQHPGAAHYVIHAFDSREHAILALPAARVYARIAPAAGHAQHMPSHTFSLLGMWDEMVPSNERAYAASVEWGAARGEPAWRRDWHAYSWLVAALIERGQVGRARALIDDAHAILAAAGGQAASMRGAYADMVAAYLNQTGRWDEVEALVAPVFEPAPGEGEGGAVAWAPHAPGGGADVRYPAVQLARLTAEQLRAEAAIARGDRAAAERAIAAMGKHQGDMKPWAALLKPREKRWLEVSSEAYRARAALGPRPSPAALRRALAALEAVEKLDGAIGVAGPAFQRSPRIIRAELLLAAGRPAEALAVYEAELDVRPRRAVALLGAAGAAGAAGLADRASGFRASLAEVWHEADAEVAAAAELRTAGR